jgi:hypothetical protein
LDELPLVLLSCECSTAHHLKFIISKFANLQPLWLFVGVIGILRFLNVDNGTSRSNSGQTS